MAAEPMTFPQTIGSTMAVSPSVSSWSLAGAQAGVESIANPAALGRVVDATGNAAYAIAKRAVDIIVAATLLLVLLPVFALIGLAITLDSGAPVFYLGSRVGRFGRPFRALKFRSMREGADQSAHIAFIQSLLREETKCAVYKVPNDARITRVGGFLRRTSLDELPQLWNVLRGEMSLVGPRPDVPYAVDEYTDWMRVRLVAKPGITGLWQVSGRSRLSLVDMYRLDVSYIAQASLFTDLSILVRTLPVVLGRDGAS
jgi:lipopolysaccharide/colanic/teichoic acid biosynthesis glycosyltransferase